MSFADHIRACNNFDRRRVVPLLARGRQIGWLRRDNAWCQWRLTSSRNRLMAHLLPGMP